MKENQRLMQKLENLYHDLDYIQHELESHEDDCDCARCDEIIDEMEKLEEKINLIEEHISQELLDE